MNLKLLLCSTIVMAGQLQAQLHHGRPASLHEHMREVNAQWELQDRIPAGASEMVAFHSEADRIATHLHFVHGILSASTAEGLSADQARHRSELLQRLDEYADRGIFPINHVLPYRNPVFIDPYGTACAVGQLIIESGHRDLAESISDRINTAYLSDIIADPQFRPEVSEWASTHGFTADELAWIQPGYPPTHPWMPLGEGTDGPVKVLLPLQNGSLLVAGNFSTAGGNAMNNVAIWDGATYSPLGSGVAGDINSAVEFNGDIYLGGSSLSGNHDLAHWDGSQWSFHTIFDGKFPLINTLHVHDSMLYAGGEMMGFAGVDHSIHRINSDYTHTQIGSFFNGKILTMETYNGFLVAGGEFTGLVNATDPLIAHVALLEGNEWSQLADGVDATVRDLLTVGSDLYVAGDLFANIAVTFGLAKLTNMAPAFELLLPNHADYMSNLGGPSYINAIAMHENELWFTGRFDLYTFTEIGNTVGRYLGAPDMVEPMINVEAPGNAIASVGEQVIVGGEFVNLYPYIIALDLTTSIGERDAAGLQISPNPVRHELIIDADAIGPDAAIEIIDAAGRIAAVPQHRSDRTIRISVEDLAPGTYVLRAVTDRGAVSSKFVKQ